MLIGNDIGAFIQFLTAHNICFWHACQLIDFQSYCILRGIPSRSLMVQSRLPFTPFESDATDNIRGFDRLVFGNFSDFGQSFQFQGRALPNPYGPIVLKFSPQCFLGSTDIAVCDRSAGAANFNRAAEAMDLMQIQALLRQGRGGTNYLDGNTEVSCTTPNQLISFSNLLAIKVDGYEFQAGRLQDLAEAAFRPLNAMFPNPRWISRNGNHQLLAELIEAGQGRTITSMQQGLRGTPLDQWAQHLNLNLNYQARRFANYLNVGTLTAAGPLRRSVARTP
jgi:hypothetical protein